MSLHEAIAVYLHFHSQSTMSPSQGAAYADACEIIRQNAVMAAARYEK